MALKLEVASLDEVPEALRSEYKNVDGKFFLDAEGITDALGAKSKLQEFRENNVKLLKERDALKSSSVLATEEVNELKRLKTLEAELKGKQTISVSEFEDRLKERMSSMREELTASQRAAEERAVKSEAAFERERLGNTLRSAAVKAGVRSTALEDVLLRGDRAFKLVDGEVAVVDPKGEVRYGRDGQMTADEWLVELNVQAPHLFEPNTGAGATGTTQTKGGRVDFDSMSPQAQIAYGLREKGYK